MNLLLDLAVAINRFILGRSKLFLHFVNLPVEKNAEFNSKASSCGLFVRAQKALKNCIFPVVFKMDCDVFSVCNTF